MLRAATGRIDLVDVHRIADDNEARHAHKGVDLARWVRHVRAVTVRKN